MYTGVIPSINGERESLVAVIRSSASSLNLRLGRRERKSRRYDWVPNSGGGIWYIGTCVNTLLYVRTNEETIRSGGLKAPTGKRSQTSESAVPSIGLLCLCGSSRRVEYRTMRIGYGHG